MEQRGTRARRLYEYLCKKCVNGSEISVYQISHDLGGKYTINNTKSTNLNTLTMVLRSDLKFINESKQFEHCFFYTDDDYSIYREEDKNKAKEWIIEHYYKPAIKKLKIAWKMAKEYGVTLEWRKD